MSGCFAPSTDFWLPTTERTATPRNEGQRTCAWLHRSVQASELLTVSHGSDSACAKNIEQLLQEVVWSIEKKGAHAWPGSSGVGCVMAEANSSNLRGLFNEKNLTEVLGRNVVMIEMLMLNQTHHFQMWALVWMKPDLVLRGPRSSLRLESPVTLIETDRDVCSTEHQIRHLVISVLRGSAVNIYPVTISCLLSAETDEEDPMSLLHWNESHSNECAIWSIRIECRNAVARAATAKKFQQRVESDWSAGWAVGRKAKGCFKQ